MVKPIAGALEVLWWWGAAVGVWLLTLSSVPLTELAVAIAAALPCALAAVGARAAMQGRWHLRPHWLLWLAALPVAVLADSARVIAAAFRERVRGEMGGELQDVQLPRGEPRMRARARRAVGGSVISATPSSLLVDEVPEEDLLVLHAFASGSPQIERVVRW